MSIWQKKCRFSKKNAKFQIKGALIDDFDCFWKTVKDAEFQIKTSIIDELYGFWVRKEKRLKPEILALTPTEMMKIPYKREKRSQGALN